MWEQLNKGQIHKLKNLLADYGHRSVNILDKWSAKTGLFSPFLWRAWRHSGPKEECFLFVHGEYLVMPLGFQSHLPALPRSAKDPSGTPGDPHHSSGVLNPKSSASSKDSAVLPTTGSSTTIS
jgi:hypothetical protein